MQLLKEKINSAYSASNLPVGKITLALKQVASEVRDGVRDSRDGLDVMSRRIDAIEAGIGLSMAGMAAVQQRRYETATHMQPPPDLGRGSRREEQVFYPRQPPPAKGKEDQKQEPQVEESGSEGGK